MGRDHANELPGSSDEWCRLAGKYAGLKIGQLIFGISHELAPSDFRRNGAFSREQREPAGALRVGTHPFPEPSRLGIKPSERKQPQFAG